MRALRLNKVVETKAAILLIPQSVGVLAKVRCLQLVIIFRAVVDPG
jgi:hypothetical protein